MTDNDTAKTIPRHPEIGKMTQHQKKVIAIDTAQIKSNNNQGQRNHPMTTACGEAFEKHFEQAVSQLFDQIDDELFTLSDKAESSTLQTIYFDAMRAVRIERDGMQRRYLQALSAQYDDFWRTSKRQQGKEPLDAANKGSFSLVENEVLEEDLAISTMIDKGNNLFDQDIHALNMRFAVLSGKEKVTNDENPVAPDRVCRSFERILKQLDIDLNIKLVIYKLFDRVVLSQSGTVYDEMNALLVEHNVLPALTRRIRRTPDGSASANRHHPSPDAAGIGDQNAESYLEAFQMMQSLLNGCRVQLGIPASSNSTSGPNYQSDEVMNALSLLQTSSETTQNDVVALSLKRYVAGELKKLQPGGQNRPIAKVDEDAIDMVSMVFDFILDDKNLPNPVKALIGRLQIPVVKAAILEKSFFSKQSHPARQLLNSLARVGVTLSEEHCEGTPVFQKIESVVQRILTEFEHDIGLFSELAEEFSNFMDKDDQRSHTVEDRTIQVTASQEQRALGKTQVAHEIARRIHGQQLPIIIRDFLEGPWSDVLFLAFLRKGKDAEGWENALTIMEQLLHSIIPPSDNEGKHRILKDVPRMLKGIRKGLETISYDPHKMEQLFKHLETCHVAMLTGDSPALTASGPATGVLTGPLERVRIDSSQVKDPLLAAEIEAIAAQLAQTDDITSSDTASDGNVAGGSEEIVLQSTGCGDRSTERSDDFLVRAQLLEVGQWLELTDENNKKFRAKLSWKSPVTSLCVFVNRKGVKVTEKTPQGLAAELRRGSAVLLEGGQVPLMDRAFTAVMNTLKNPEKKARKEARAYLSQTVATSSARQK